MNESIRDKVRFPVGLGKGGGGGGVQTKAGLWIFSFFFLMNFEIVFILRAALIGKNMKFIIAEQSFVFSFCRIHIFIQV